MPVGPRQDEFMNTVVGGPADAPALVMIPGRWGHSNLPCVAAGTCTRNTPTAVLRRKMTYIPSTRHLAGYGAGIGFFFRNLAALTQEFRVHAVDLLGTGMSGAHSLLQETLQKKELKGQDTSNPGLLSIGGHCSAHCLHPERPHCASGRPPFRAKDRAGAEAFFLESLAKWRQQMGIDKMVLVGHSLVR